MTTMKDFIRKNRNEIDLVIKQAVPLIKITNEEREIWVLNDEGLYNLAKSKGVRI